MKQSDDPQRKKYKPWNIGNKIADVLQKRSFLTLGRTYTFFGRRKSDYKQKCRSSGKNSHRKLKSLLLIDNFYRKLRLRKVNIFKFLRIGRKYFGKIDLYLIKSADRIKYFFKGIILRTVFVRYL